VSRRELEVELGSAPGLASEEVVAVVVVVGPEDEKTRCDQLGRRLLISGVPGIDLQPEEQVDPDEPGFPTTTTRARIST